MIGKPENEHRMDVQDGKDEADPVYKDLLHIEEDTVGREREDFRKYLEQSGVMESLIKAMTDLFLEEARPEDAIDYIKSYLIDRHRPEGEASVLRYDLREARKEIKNLRKKVEQLSARLDKYEEVKDDE